MVESDGTNRLPHSRSALILYGSETGVSQDAAEQLGRICERLRFYTSVQELDTIDVNLIHQYTIVIFTISTTGQGELPNNSRKFWKSLLRKRLSPTHLGQLSFALFGLGDSSYTKFNWAAKKLHKRLQQLGATEFYPFGEGDEQHEEGIDGAFLPWSLDLKRKLLLTHPLSEGILPIPDDEFLPPKFVLAIAHDNKTSAMAAMSQSTHTVVNSSHALLSRVESRNTSPKGGADMVSSRVITNEARADQISTSAMEFQTGMAGAQRRTEASLLSNRPFEVDIFNQVEDAKTSNPGVKEYFNSEDLIQEYDRPPTDLLPIPHAYTAKVMVMNRITKDGHFQDVKQLSLNIADKIEYEPGDTVSLYPKNYPSDVDALLKLQNWESMADVPLHFEPTSTSYGNPKFHPSLRNMHTTDPCTLRSLLLHNLDITAIPRRYFFEQIGHFTSDETHKERLFEFSNPAHTDEFFDYATRPRRSILEILQDFSTVQIPFKYCSTIFPILRPRQFSIASGGTLATSPLYLRHEDKDNTRIDLCIAMVKYRTVLRKVRQGVCSRWLSTLQPGTLINITLQAGSYPKTISIIEKPILMIAPGTGIAPMRSLIYERSWLHEELKDDYDNEVVKIREGTSKVKNLRPMHKLGSATLIFGNRNSDADYLFSDEWTTEGLFQDFKVFTAWSRDYPRGDNRNKYVQDVIREKGDLVFQLLNKQGGTVFVCGSSGKMPLGVKTAIIDVFRDVGKMSEDDATMEVGRLEKLGRYVQETW